MASRSEWLEGRKKGIGGSDWGDVLSIEPYGCQRRCWYSKTGVEPDYPEENSGVLKRGHKLEPLVFDEFEETQGRDLWRPDPENATADFEQSWGFAESFTDGSDLPEWWIGTPDAVILPTDVDLPGIFEAKTAGPYPYAKIVKEGIPETTIAQRQHYLGLSGMSYGVVGYLEPCYWNFLPIGYDRDEEMLSLMRDVGDKFWNLVESGTEPDRLDAADHRCKSCRWYPTCWDSLVFTGDDTKPDGDYKRTEDPKLSELFSEKEKARREVKGTEEMINEIDAEILRHLGGTEEADGRKVQLDCGKIRVATSKTSRVDQKAFEAKYPRIAKAINEKFRRTYLGSIPSVYIYPKKKKGAKK